MASLSLIIVVLNADLYSCRKCKLFCLICWGFFPPPPFSFQDCKSDGMTLVSSAKNSPQGPVSTSILLNRFDSVTEFDLLNCFSHQSLEPVFTCDTLLLLK